ncbi:MAG TPA: YbhB/YbcL family Raf kinase inhibitor-like protein [Thermodesulfobacteriota bacterium]|nr:YbhB/YbcL family Raf kinase inhibitor-like protein [Thermodesulfobacteriota bacterium]
MKRLQISVLVFLQVFLFSYAMGQSGIKVEGLKLSCPAFENGAKIPKKYTCDGANVNPPLTIENVPSDTKSLALVFDDIEAPRGSYVHWILWNLAPDVKEIKEDSVPEGVVQGLNDFKKPNYGGPCPPGRTHKYVFKIYALDTLLNLNPKSTKKDLEKLMEGHVLSRAQLTGLYKRN